MAGRWTLPYAMLTFCTRWAGCGCVRKSRKSCEAQALHAHEKRRCGRPRIMVEVEARACPLRQLLWGASVSTARVAYDASGLGRCDGRHGFLFEYPIIFWT